MWQEILKTIIEWVWLLSCQDRRNTIPQERTTSSRFYKSSTRIRQHNLLPKQLYYFTLALKTLTIIKCHIRAQDFEVRQHSFLLFLCIHFILIIRSQQATQNSCQLFIGQESVQIWTAARLWVSHLTCDSHWVLLLFTTERKATCRQSCGAGHATGSQRWDMCLSAATGINSTTVHQYLMWQEKLCLQCTHHPRSQ